MAEILLPMPMPEAEAEASATAPPASRSAGGCATRDTSVQGHDPARRQRQRSAAHRGDACIEAGLAHGMRDRLIGTTGRFSDRIEAISGRRIQGIRQRIRAVSLPEARAGPLRARADSAALELRRQYVQAPGTIAEVTLSLHPGERFTHSTVLSRKT